MMQIYEIRIVYGLDEDGEPAVGFFEEGTTDVITKLGLLSFTKDTILGGH